jgi:tetraacyldisaccharide 4'-kinase
MALRKFYLLYPFALVYRLITDIRNLMYDSGILSSVSFDLPVIGVGNITVGGTGKTPHTEYLAYLLSQNNKVAVLSRGYRRKTKGYLEVGKESTVGEVGDEPLQIAEGFPGIVVAVEGNRVAGVKTILEKHPGTDVVILDDAFQHRSIKAGLSILLTDLNRLITRDSVLPTGRLREKWTNAARADIIIVSKSHVSMSGIEMDQLKSELKIKPHQQLFFTATTYSEPKPVFHDHGEIIRIFKDEKSGQGVVLITGIASPEPLKSYLKKYFCEIIHLDYPDHHYFNSNDITRIAGALRNINAPRKFVITTSKDAVRLREIANIDPDLKKILFHIPVSVRFLGGGKAGFDKIILDYVGKNKKNTPVPQIKRNS